MKRLSVKAKEIKKNKEIPLNTRILTVEKEVRIPGTDIILEKGDKIKVFSQAITDKKSVVKEQGVDSWKGGTWEDGIWEGGTWYDGTWKYGIWKSGLWITGEWIDGIWESGKWKSGTWVDGLWKGGKIWNPNTKDFEYSLKNPNETEWSLSYKRAY
jgi:hypothetical protein